MQEQRARSLPSEPEGALEAYERRLIESALAATHGNQRRAAQALGLLPTTLHEKLKRLGCAPRRTRTKTLSPGPARTGPPDRSSSASPGAPPAAPHR